MLPVSALKADLRVAIKSNFTLLERAVAQFDSRFTLRALRSISILRKKLTGEILGKAVATTYPLNSDNGTPKALLRAIGMDEQAALRVKEEWKKNTAGKDPIPVIDIYLAILIQASSRGMISFANSTRSISTIVKTTSLAQSSQRFSLIASEA